MRSFGSHLAMLLLGLSAGVVLAVLGFNPMGDAERVAARGRAAAGGRAMPGMRVAKESREEKTVDAAPPADAEPLAPTRSAEEPMAPPTDGSIRGRLLVDREDESSGIGVIASRVAVFDPSDPELLASSFDPRFTGFRQATRCLRVSSGRFDFESLPPGHYWLVAVLGGQAVGEQRVELAPGASLEADLEVKAALFVLRVNVLDDHDEPLREATLSVDTTLESALGPRTTQIPTFARPVADGHFRVALPAVAASVRAGRLTGSSTLVVDCYGFESRRVPLSDFGEAETTIRMERKTGVTTGTLRIHVVLAPGSREPDSIGIRMMGPSPTEKNPKAHEVGFWSDFDEGGDAHFAAIPPGLYQLSVVAHAGDSLPAVTILTREVEVAATPEALTIELPRLFRITVVAPADLAAFCAELTDAGASGGAPLQTTTLGCETHFPLVPEGLHEIRFGPRRMRLEVHEDRRVEFVADPALEAGDHAVGR